jgi:hypothetical protein
MENLLRYFLFVFIVLTLNGQSNSAKNRCDSLKGALFSDNFKDWHKDGIVERVIDELIEGNCPEYEKTLYRFSLENTLYRSYSLKKMAKCRMHSFITFLYKYGDSLDAPTMFDCMVSLNPGAVWTNDSLMDYITHLVISHLDAGTRTDALNRLVKSARYEDCNVLADKIIFEPDESNIRRYYRTLVRFSSKKIDSVVSKHIPNIIKYDDVFFDKLEEYNRYDFLPELYTLRDRLKKEENPLKKKDATEMLIRLDKVLPILEKKKAEKAPIGLPLDWGIEKKDGKVKISNK